MDLVQKFYVESHKRSNFEILVNASWLNKTRPRWRGVTAVGNTTALEAQVNDKKQALGSAPIE
jgi:hypothetical protein